MKIRKKFNPMLAIVLVFSILASILCYLRIFYAQDSFVADAMYQTARPQAEDIVLINIDQQSLDELGPFASWGRGLMGDVINILNQDPDNAPAVIGLDVLYVGHSDDPDGDAYLVDACANSCPVVVACAGTFGTQTVEQEDGSFYVDNNALFAFDEPYEELKAVTYPGQINSMFDDDGVLRHGLWEIKLDDGRSVPAWHRQVYELYCSQTGNEAQTQPDCDRLGRYYVPFQAKPGDFSDGYGVIDLLNGEIPSDYYTGKIVLIGPYAAGMQDDFVTAIDHSQKMYGVEYQANMIQALIRGETKKEVSRLPQALLVLFVSLILGIFFIDRKMFPATLVWLVTSGAYIAICLFAGGKGYLLSPLYLLLCITMMYVISVAFNYIRAALEKRRVTSTFQRYVAPEIVHELLEEGGEATELGGRECEIAVLFVDIRGFTTMSEKLEPARVVEILNEYLTLTTDCVFKNHGTLDKFVGDCTMAFWGAPLPQEDCIFKAVKAGFDMIEGAKSLSQELKERYGETVDFGVGVNFGKAVVGNIGAKNRMDYTAIGDTVNTAARLEANAPGGKIYVSRTVADALQGRVRFESLGDTIQLKGKAAGFEILSAVELLDKGE